MLASIYHTMTDPSWVGAILGSLQWAEDAAAGDVDIASRTLDVDKWGIGGRNW